MGPRDQAGGGGKKATFIDQVPITKVKNRPEQSTTLHLPLKKSLFFIEANGAFLGLSRKEWGRDSWHPLGH